MSLKTPKIEGDIDEAMEKVELPEAKSSVSYSLFSKDGYSVIFTVRASDEAELMDEMVTNVPFAAFSPANVARAKRNAPRIFTLITWSNSSSESS